VRTRVRWKPDTRPRDALWMDSTPPKHGRVISALTSRRSTPEAERRVASPFLTRRGTCTQVPSECRSNVYPRCVASSSCECMMTMKHRRHQQADQDGDDRDHHQVVQQSIRLQKSKCTGCNGWVGTVGWGAAGKFKCVRSVLSSARSTMSESGALTGKRLFLKEK